MVLRLVQRHLTDIVVSIAFSVYDIEYRYPIGRLEAHQADVVRSLSWVTATETALAFGIFQEANEVVTDSVDLTLVSPTSTKTPCRIATASQLAKAKDVDFVLRAFALVHFTIPDARLRVLGDGPETRRLRALAEDLGVAQAVDFLDHVSQMKVMEEMQQAEVFLFLPPTGRLPNTVKEAAVSGCVCVVRKMVGADELFSKHELEGGSLQPTPCDSNPTRSHDSCVHASHPPTMWLQRRHDTRNRRGARGRAWTPRTRWLDERSLEATVTTRNPAGTAMRAKSLVVDLGICGRSECRRSPHRGSRSRIRLAGRDNGSSMGPIVAKFGLEAVSETARVAR